MLSQQQQYPRGDDRERITRARQAAEALFSPKRQITEQLVSDTPPADQAARKPRVLSIALAAPTRHEEFENSGQPRAADDARDPAVAIRARIRTLVKYGMTVVQVAELYGAAVGEIERISRTA